MDAWSYAGKNVVVTGCASGIGRAAARELSRLGAEVTGLDLNQPEGDSVSHYVPVDLSNESSIDDAAQVVEGPVHAIFNCAGISDGAGAAPFVMAVNFIGLRHLTESLIPRLTPGGAIASVASLSAVDVLENLDAVLDFLRTSRWAEAETWCEGHPDQFVPGGYRFSKECVIGYTMLRSGEVAEKKNRINCISPGPVDTPLLEMSVRVPGNREFLERFPRPLGRFAQPEEQANVLIFLNSDAASFVTGQNVWTDGGYLAGVTVGQIPPVIGRAAAR